MSYDHPMPLNMKPATTPEAYTTGARIVRPRRTDCIEAAAHLLAASFRRLDEAKQKAPATGEGLPMVERVTTPAVST